MKRIITAVLLSMTLAVPAAASHDVFTWHGKHILRCASGQVGEWRFVQDAGAVNPGYVGPMLTITINGEQYVEPYRFWRGETIDWVLSGPTGLLTRAVSDWSQPNAPTPVSPPELRATACRGPVGPTPR